MKSHLRFLVSAFGFLWLTCCSGESDKEIPGTETSNTENSSDDPEACSLEHEEELERAVRIVNSRDSIVYVSIQSTVVRSPDGAPHPLSIQGNCPTNCDDPYTLIACAQERDSSWLVALEPGSSYDLPWKGRYSKEVLVGDFCPSEPDESICFSLKQAPDDWSLVVPFGNGQECEEPSDGDCGCTSRDDGTCIANGAILTGAEEAPYVVGTLTGAPTELVIE